MTALTLNCYIPKFYTRIVKTINSEDNQNRILIFVALNI